MYYDSRLYVQHNILYSRLFDYHQSLPFSHLAGVGGYALVCWVASYFDNAVSGLHFNSHVRGSFNRLFYQLFLKYLLSKERDI